MHGNTNVTKKNYDKIKIIIIKKTYALRLFDKLSYLTKITLKKPLSRGSRFKIYFRLKHWGNHGSRHNFLGIPFFKDNVLIKPDHPCHANPYIFI